MAQSHNVDSLLDDYGKLQGRVELIEVKGFNTRIFERAGGLVLLEMLLGRAGLLDVPGKWRLRPVQTNMNAIGQPIIVREASKNTVRLKMQPKTHMTAIEGLLIVERGQGEPDDVRQKLLAAVAGMMQAAVPRSPGETVDVDAEVNALLADWESLRTVLCAVGDAGTDPHADTLPKFVSAVSLEMGHGQSQHRWAMILCGLAKRLILRERRAGGVVTGYSVTEAGLAMVSDETLVPASEIHVGDAGDDMPVADAGGECDTAGGETEEAEKAEAVTPAVPTAVVATLTPTAAPAATQAVAALETVQPVPALRLLGQGVPQLSAATLGVLATASVMMQQIADLQRQQAEMVRQRDELDLMIEMARDDERAIVAKLSADDLHAAIAVLQDVERMARGSRPAKAV